MITESGAEVPLRPVTIHALRHRMNCAGPPRPIIWARDTIGRASGGAQRVELCYHLVVAPAWAPIVVLEDR
jgi:hypothetical protein